MREVAQAWWLCFPCPAGHDGTPSAARLPSLVASTQSLLVLQRHNPRKLHTSNPYAVSKCCAHVLCPSAVLKCCVRVLCASAVAEFCVRVPRHPRHPHLPHHPHHPHQACTSSTASTWSCHYNVTKPKHLEASTINHQIEPSHQSQRKANQPWLPGCTNPPSKPPSQRATTTIVQPRKQLTTHAPTTASTKVIQPKKAPPKSANQKNNSQPTST